MSTANKLTYLNDTKGLLKQKINNLGGDITDQTTFRQYADKLQTIYDNAPKTDFEEGSNITLENCLKGKLDFENDIVGYGDTEQESTTGKNLLPNTLTSGTSNGITWTVNSDGTIKVNGTATGNVALYVARGLTLTSGSYILSGCPSGGSNTTYSMVLEGTARDTGNGKTFTEASNKSVIIEIISGTICNNLLFMPMIETGSTITTYEQYTGGIPAPNPTYPFPVQVVTGEQEVTIRGKNKLKINDVTLTSNGVTLTVQDNYFILNGTNNGTESVFQLSNYITPFKTNSNTKLKAFQISGTASGNLLNTFFRTYSNWANQVNINFTQTTMSSYSAELTYNNCMLALAGGTYTDYKIGIMVADNLTSDDTFENYITPITKTLNLGNLEFAEIGDYRDYIWTDRETGKWYKHSKLIKLQLTSDLDWGGLFVSQINLYRVDTDAFADIIEHQSSSSQFGLCNRYINSWNDTMVNLSAGHFAVFTDGKIYITTQFTTNNMQGWKDFLDNNEVYVIVPLATPTDTEITDTSLINQLEEIYNIMSNNGTTIIEIAGTLPMIMKVRALKGE